MWGEGGGKRGVCFTIRRAEMICLLNDGVASKESALSSNAGTRGAADQRSPGN